MSASGIVVEGNVLTRPGRVVEMRKPLNDHCEESTKSDVCSGGQKEQRLTNHNSSLHRSMLRQSAV